MNTILYRLGSVPEDEADEIRELLESHRFDWFETEPRLFGLSPPAIWLRDPDQLEAARELLDRYHRERAERVRDEHRQLQEQGLVPGMFQRLLQNPFRVLLFLLLAATVAFFTVMPFLWLG